MSQAYTNTWSLTLREEQRLRVFENKVGLHRKVFGAKGRVAIRPVFAGRVLIFRVGNSVRADFFNLAKCPGFLINDRLSLFPINSMLSWRF